MIIMCDDSPIELERNEHSEGGNQQNQEQRVLNAGKRTLRRWLFAGSSRFSHRFFNCLKHGRSGLLGLLERAWRAIVGLTACSASRGRRFARGEAARLLPMVWHGKHNRYQRHPLFFQPSFAINNHRYCHRCRPYTSHMPAMMPPPAAARRRGAAACLLDVAQNNTHNSTIGSGRTRGECRVCG